MEAVGTEFTVTFWVEVLEHPWAEVTVTVYVPDVAKVFAAVLVLLPPFHW
jgi:hypothetical protein